MCKILEKTDLASETSDHEGLSKVESHYKDNVTGEIICNENFYDVIEPETKSCKPEDFDNFEKKLRDSYISTLMNEDDP